MTTPSSNPSAPAAEASASVATAAPASTAEHPQEWLNAIASLVEQLELSPAEVTKAILEAKLVGKPSVKGAATLLNPQVLSFDDFRRAFPDVALGDLKQAISQMHRATAPAAASSVGSTAATAAAVTAGYNSSAGLPGPFVIPDFADGDNFLQALSESKTLTVDAVTIRAALEAYFAEMLGLSDIPERLAAKMEDFADRIEEPVGSDFMNVLRLVRERRYAEVNVDSRLVTMERKKKFLARLRELPGAVYQFHSSLAAWYDQHKSQQASNPLGILSGSFQYPPHDDVVASAEHVVGALKRSFAGFGVMAAKSLAYEALRTRQTLMDEAVVRMTGAVNREMMLKELGLAISNADVRLERNVAKYVLFVATMVPTGLPGGQEGRALEALYNLGEQIRPWMEGGRGAGNGVRDARRQGGGNGDPRRPDSPFPMGGHNNRLSQFSAERSARSIAHFARLFCLAFICHKMDELQREVFVLYNKEYVHDGWKL